jgi:predicted deacylase
VPNLHSLRVDGATGLAGSEVPYLEFGNTAGGPTICLLAGIHGCEYSSMLGLRTFLDSIDEAQLRGRILAVPIANLAAFEARTAFVVPHDGLNLNRAFPGSPDGSFTERLAHQLFETVIRPSDYLVDCHAGDQVEALEPFTIYDESPVEDRARAMAHAYGLGYSVRTERSASPIAGTTSAAAAEIGIPAIIAEAGGCGLVDEISVKRHVDGLTRVLAEVGILDSTQPAPPRPVEIARWVWLRTAKAGWWSAAVTAGQQVSAGRLVGTVSSLVEDDVEEVLAPESGVPLFVTTSPAVAADGLLLGLGIV